MASKMTAEELKAKITSAKEDRDAAKEEFAGYCKEKGLSTKEAPSGDKEKYGVKWKKLHDQVDKKRKVIEELQAKKGEVVKVKKERNFKYDYPANVTTSEERKKYRAEVRAAKRKEEKAAKKGETPAKGKKVKSKPETKKAAPSKKSKSKPTKKAETPETTEAVETDVD